MRTRGAISTKKNITNFILLVLEKAVDGYVRFEDFAYNTGYYSHGNGWSFPLKKASLAQALKRLRKNGLVDFVDDEKLAVRLTDQGREKAVLARIKLDEGKWDGKWRLVIFDVPEKRRAVRDLLRSKLKQWDFIHFQQSVWGTKKDCAKVLRNFIKSVGIEDWVMVVESDNIGR